jgi:4-hydroxy-tetrahydrodipicolinate synthase
MRARLSGPLPSLKTPFTLDGAIDFPGLRRLIDFNLAAGAKALMLTAGDSQYVALTEQEIAEVTKVTVEHTAGRALVIAADRYYHTAQAVAFAHFAHNAGADLLMVMPPDWGASATPQTFADHYRAVSAVMPVMLVSNVFIARGAKFGYDTLKLTLAEADNVVAIKDDMCGEFARKMSLLVHDQWAVVSGGQKQNHLNNHPYGCDGYLSTFISLKPEISHAYWRATQANDLPEMKRIIRDYDHPFFDLVLGLPGGFNAGIQATLELKGIAGRWRRKPYYSLSDRELEIFADNLRRLHLLD